MAHLIQLDEPDPADPMYPRYEAYLERLTEFRRLQSEHQARAAAEADVPVEHARKVLLMGALQRDEEDSMTLHTLEAMRLYLGATPAPGESRFGVPGGRRAATALRQLFLLTSGDNPYADATLVDVDQRLGAITQKVRQIEAKHVKLLDDMRARGLKYSVLGAQHPQAVSLGYRSPYGYAISNMMVNFDYCVRVIKSAERRDLISKADVRQTLHEIKHQCRSLFEMVLRASRVLLNDNLRALSRADYLPQADEAAVKRAAAVRQVLGPLPQSVYTGELAPRHSLRNERLSAKERELLQQAASAMDAAATSESDGSGTADTAGLVD
ncbi:MAG: TIGR03761 family integrating conjugative element protein [Burkholderiaceae bacterium]|nr:TIGR03761 family integrating conjugative element protein [Burkholderiaceae bacterium]